MAGKNQPSGGRLLIEARDRDIERRRKVQDGSGGTGALGLVLFLVIGCAVFYFGYWKPAQVIKEADDNYIRSKAIGTLDGIPRDSEGKAIKQDASDLGYPRNFGADGEAQWSSGALDALEAAQGAVRAHSGTVLFEESRFYVVEESAPGKFRVFGRFGKPGDNDKTGRFEAFIEGGQVVSSSVRP